MALPNDRSGLPTNPLTKPTASDVRALIAHVQAVVVRETGYHMEPEISFVGEHLPPSRAEPTRMPEGQAA